MGPRLRLSSVEPLLHIARGGPHSDVRASALDAAARLPLDESAWRGLGVVAEQLVLDLEPGSQARRSAIEAMARIPLVSVRSTLRKIAQGGHDAETAAAALARARDASSVPYLLRSIREGPALPAMEWLAAVPIERLDFAPADLWPRLDDEDVHVRFWCALALARLGEFGPIDRFLSGREAVPPMFHGNPGTPYKAIAAIRPLPDGTRDHLLASLPHQSDLPESEVARANRITIWAATGVADAEGSPLESPADVDSPGGTGRADTSPAPAPLGGVEGELVARRVSDLLFHPEADGWQLEEALVRLPDLASDTAAGLTLELVERGNRVSAESQGPRGQSFGIGNAIIKAVSRLEARDDWPVAALYREHVGARRPALDEGQFAWVVSRARAPKAIEEIVSVTSESRSPEEKAKALRFLGLLADEYAGRAGSPLRGDGPSEPSGDTRTALIDDTRPEPHETRGAYAAPAPGSGGRGAGLPMSPPPRAASPRPDPSDDDEPTASSDAVREIRRTPHMDLGHDDPVPAGTEFTVHVYADSSPPRDGERGDELVILAPARLKVLEVEVWLDVSEELEVRGVNRRWLNLDPAAPSTGKVEFRVRVRPLPTTGSASDGRPVLEATFFHSGRSSGRVRRTVRIASPTSGTEPPTGPADDTRHHKACLAVTLEPREADLNLHVRRRPGDVDGRVFRARAWSPHLPDSKKGPLQTWRVAKGSAAFVRDLMETFVAPGLGGDARRLQLLGAGRLLFKAAPRAFQEMYWRLVDSGKPPKTIAVVTDEPHMPWELMVPSRNHRGKREVREPLGISAAVGRWVAGDAVAAPQVIPLDRGCFVLAPTYQGADLLEHSEREAALVLGKFQGVRIQPATLAGITSALRGRDASLIHVVAHGKTGAVEQTIRLESEFLTSIQLPELLDDTGVLDGGPTLVVLNACEVGRQVPALVGDSGFAPAFIDAGASAVVAALWSVKDGIANDVARRFYEAVSGDPTRSFADILKDIRKLAYDEATGAEDTYAAYCFYGDPFAAPSS